MIAMRFGVSILFAELPVSDAVGIAPRSHQLDLSCPRISRRNMFASDCSSQLRYAVERNVRAPPRHTLPFSNTC